MKDYIHTVQYYETDQMGFVHHSNYIRWFEEARMDLLDQLGLPYAAMEQKGFLSPVLEVRCRYKQAARFGEAVAIQARLTEFGNVRYRLSYTVRDRDTGVLRAEGESEHCFINREGRPIALKRHDPELAQSLLNAVEP